MSNSILDYFADSRGSHLHARGQFATDALVLRIDCKPGENVLEFGIGTGATIVQMASTFPETTFFGLEVSDKMLKTALRRIQRSHLSEKIQLIKSESNVLPFSGNSFDSIYVESVLAIQSNENLTKILSEFARILKSGGKLIFNETIWLKSTKLDQIERINAACLESFGIIQSSGDCPYLNDWIELLRQCQFEVLSAVSVTDLPEIKEKSRRTLSEKRSRFYSIFGTIQSKIHLKMRRNWGSYQKSMKSIAPPGIRLMEGYLVEAINKK